MEDLCVYADRPFAFVARYLRRRALPQQLGEHPARPAAQHQHPRGRAGQRQPGA